ncbi:hypothetical protein C8R45DRAFT_1012555 [Mycena sanguinolenta]|nr:hypothetical protein C8R45DRAFT_1012555 [Mycena sanguinolenta]
MAMSLSLTWMLFLLPIIRALPFNIASSDSSTGAKHDVDKIVILSLVFCLFIYRVVYPVLVVIMSRHRVAFRPSTRPSVPKIGVPRVNIFSVPQETAQPFTRAQSEPEAGGSSSIPNPLATVSVSSVVLSSQQPSLESARLSTAGSIYSTSQHSLASSDVTHYFPSDSEWNDAATVVAEVIPRN